MFASAIDSRLSHNTIRTAKTGFLPMSFLQVSLSHTHAEDRRACSAFWRRLQRRGVSSHQQTSQQQGNRATKPVVALAAVGFIALAGHAEAADKPGIEKSPPQKQPAQTCNVNWYQGWYTGLNFGGVGYTASRTDQDAQLINVATYTQRNTGYFGGGQLGYNWTTCHGLFGIELDGSAGSAVASTGLLPNSTNADVSITSRFNVLVTTRARAGIVMDGTLLYVTGGVAAAHTLTTYLNIAGDQFSFNNWSWGWIAGVGGELAVASNISLRSEVLYVGIADHTYTFISPTLGPGNFTHSDAAWIIRAGLNVKLGFEPAIPTY
jgi:outer membrane immunogenic protein